jgi:hypothetical protein
MQNWVFLRPLFWKVLFWGLVVDWGSKGLINLLIGRRQASLSSQTMFEYCRSAPGLASPSQQTRFFLPDGFSDH